MKMNFFSKTKIGQWANSLTLIFIILIVLKLLNIQGISLPISTPIIAIFGISSFILGIIALIKERSIATILSILIGLLIISWIVFEIILSI